MYDWLVVLIDPVNKTEDIIINDKDKLEKYYNEHVGDIWIGYNSRGYDQYILKGIMCGFDPYKISKHIIQQSKPGYSFSNLFYKFPLNNYDVGSKFHGLKQLEGFMGNDIRETEVPFDLDRRLTPEELSQTIKYCRHDVEQTIEVFLQKKNDFDAHLDLIKMFKLPLSYIGKTQAQLSAIAIGCQRKEHNDEWDLEFVPTIKLDKYKHVLDWYKDPNNLDYKQSLTTTVAGLEHVFAWGGLHAGKEKYHSKGLIIHVDVTSYYPSLMIKYNLLTRNAKDPKVFKDIYDKRVALKKAGKKKEQAPYKIILNGTYGICKDIYSLAYDPRQANNVCVNGQLLLLDLIEKMETIQGFELIQSNTDGLIVKIPDTDEAFDKLDDICYEWEHRTGMGLGFDLIDEIWQKDVNNYIFRFAESGKLERKGAYVKELDTLDNDLPIVNKAMVDFMTKNIPPEVTVNSCTDLIMFQKIVKISGKYLHGWHNNKFLNDKTFRVFASKNNNDTYIGKQKTEGATIEKFANTPEHCFIDNANINNKEVPDKLDKNWYIELTKERLKQYGY